MAPRCTRVVALGAALSTVGASLLEVEGATRRSSRSSLDLSSSLENDLPTVEAPRRRRPLVGLLASKGAVGEGSEVSSSSSSSSFSQGADSSSNLDGDYFGSLIEELERKVLAHGQAAFEEEALLVQAPGEEERWRRLAVFSFDYYEPTVEPSPAPTTAPSYSPAPTTRRPTRMPTRKPTRRPTREPTTGMPTAHFPTSAPSALPTSAPTFAPLVKGELEFRGLSAPAGTAQQANVEAVFVATVADLADVDEDDVLCDCSDTEEAAAAAARRRALRFRIMTPLLENTRRLEEEEVEGEVVCKYTLLAAADLASAEDLAEDLDVVLEAADLDAEVRTSAAALGQSEAFASAAFRSRTRVKVFQQTAAPTRRPTAPPTHEPSYRPTAKPDTPTVEPTLVPTVTAPPTELSFSYSYELATNPFGSSYSYSYMLLQSQQEPSYAPTAVPTLAPAVLGSFELSGLDAVDAGDLNAVVREALGNLAGITTSRVAVHISPSKTTVNFVVTALDAADAGLIADVLDFALTTSAIEAEIRDVARARGLVGYEGVQASRIGPVTVAPSSFAPTLAPALTPAPSVVPVPVVIAISLDRAKPIDCVNFEKNNEGLLYAEAMRELLQPETVAVTATCSYLGDAYVPTPAPVAFRAPTHKPTPRPSFSPIPAPTAPTVSPTNAPTAPTYVPTGAPTPSPTPTGAVRRRRKLLYHGHDDDPSDRDGTWTTAQADFSFGANNITSIAFSSTFDDDTVSSSSSSSSSASLEAPATSLLNSTEARTEITLTIYYDAATEFVGMSPSDVAEFITERLLAAVRSGLFLTYLLDEAALRGVTLEDPIFTDVGEAEVLSVYAPTPAPTSIKCSCVKLNPFKTISYAGNQTCVLVCQIDRSM